jgi:hypothetical protein
MTPETVAGSAARFALALGFLANTEPAAPPDLFGWLFQLGALGLLAWYFLKVEPQQRREEREERRRELELLLRWRDVSAGRERDPDAARDRPS